MAESLAPLLVAPWLTAGVAVPLIAALLTRLSAVQRRMRAIAIAACALPLLFSLETVRELAASGWRPLAEPWMPNLFVADALNAVTMALFSFLALVTVLSASRRDADRQTIPAILMLTSGALASYGAGNLAIFLAGWMLASFSILAKKTGFAVSSVLLGIALILKNADASAFFTFLFLTLAAASRVGIFPFHRHVISQISNGPLLLTGLLMNAHLGIFLLIRFGLPLIPDLNPDVGPWISSLALFTAIYTAILGVVERQPRRLLGLIFVSQSSSIFCGLVTATPEGSMGGLIQWITLGIASTVLLSILRSIEARIDRPLDGEGLFGLAAQMPRMAVFFAVSALALVGLPGTLGFPGEDLLIHGVLSAHPLAGIALPATIALNAYSLYKLSARLFLGPAVPAFSAAPDANSRERWAYAVCLLLLVLGGLMPGRVVDLRSAAADALHPSAERHLNLKAEKVEKPIH